MNRLLIQARCGPKRSSVQLIVAKLLYERENIEALNLAIGKEAVYRVRLIVEHFENRIDSGHHQQLDITAVHVDQLGGAFGFLSRRRTQDQRAESGAVDEVDALHIQ